MSDAELISWRPFAMWIARDFFFPGADRDDVEQEAMIGLWEALRGWDSKRGPKRSFIGLIVRRRLIEALDVSRRFKHLVLSEAAREAVLDDERVALADLLTDVNADPALVYEQRERLAKLIHILRTRVSPLERRAIVGVMNGLAYHEIGRPKSIDNALQRAREKLARAEY